MPPFSIYFMKNYLLFVVSLVSLIAAAQPNKSKLDSVILKNDSLYSWPGGFRGAVMPALKFNARKSLQLASGGAINNGFNSTTLGSNTQIPTGNNNLSFGQNTVVECPNGGTGTGADGHIYPSASYAFITNDAQDAWGTASSSFGFGNDNYVENGIVAGNDNVLGHLQDDGLGVPNKYSSSFMLAQMSRSIGSRNLTVGRAVETRGDDIYSFGTGVDNSRTRIVADHPGSFNVGFNNKWLFQVYKEGQIVINGIPYNFPATDGPPGSVLATDGNHNLSWTAPAAVAKSVQTQEQPKAGKYMVMTTSGQLLYLVQIK